MEVMKIVDEIVVAICLASVICYWALPFQRKYSTIFICTTYLISAAIAVFKNDLLDMFISAFVSFVGLMEFTTLRKKEIAQKDQNQ